MYESDAAARTAKDAALLRQVTDQLDYDRIAAMRDAAVRNMALGAYDLADDTDFEALIATLEDVEEVLDDYLDDGMGDRQSRRERRRARKKRRRARRSARRARRKQRRKDRRARKKIKWWKRGKMRRRQYRKRRKKYWGTLRKARKEHRKERKRIRKARRHRRDRRKAGVSTTIQSRSAAEAEAASGGAAAPTDLADQQTPTGRKPIVIFGGLALATVGLIVVAKLIKGRGKDKAKGKAAETKKEKK